MSDLKPLQQYKNINVIFDEVMNQHGKAQDALSDLDIKIPELNREAFYHGARAMRDFFQHYFERGETVYAHRTK